MGNLITLAALFVAKVTDNALSTTKTIWWWIKPLTMVCIILTDMER